MAILLSLKKADLEPVPRWRGRGWKNLSLRPLLEGDRFQIGC